MRPSIKGVWALDGFSACISVMAWEERSVLFHVLTDFPPRARVRAATSGVWLAGLASPSALPVLATFCHQLGQWAIQRDDLCSCFSQMIKGASTGQIGKPIARKNGVFGVVLATFRHQLGQW